MSVGNQKGFIQPLKMQVNVSEKKINSDTSIQ